MTPHSEKAHIIRVLPDRLLDMMGAMSLVELSMLSGVSVGTLSGWKNGRRMPKLDCLFRVATVLDASVDWLIGLDEPMVSSENIQCVVIPLQRITRNED